MAAGCFSLALRLLSTPSIQQGCQVRMIRPAICTQRRRVRFKVWVAVVSDCTAPGTAGVHWANGTDEAGDATECR